MHARATHGLTIATTCFVGALLAAAPAASAKELKVISDKAVSTVTNESVAYNPKEKVYYAGDFGGAASKSADKDGTGKIVKLSLDGKVMDSGIVPGPGQPAFNKPKGIWIHGNRMWIADVDAVWLFDLKSKKGKRIEPGIGYANDVAVIKNVLYVSDNRNDFILRIEPADFFKSKDAPKVTKVYSGGGISPNGLWPGKDGSLLMVGFKSKDEPRGIYSMTLGQQPKLLSQPIGMLDGLYQMRNGDILATDWITGSLFQWNEKMGVHKLVDGIKGPADFCVVPNKQGLLVIAPDLVKGEVRFVQLGK